ncbi:MAG: aminotransferase class V-fold PLP-dependent enzyme [Candidatus Aenigmatarchaeota archaeon]
MNWKKLYKRSWTDIMNVKEVRKDFPVLKENDLVYLDNACMTLRPEHVIKSITDYYKKFPACTGRSSHDLARKATQKVKEARKMVGNFIGTKNSKEVLFTRNTTESINLVSRSLQFERGDKVLTSDREHNSNLIPWQMLEEKNKIKHDIVRSDQQEEFSIENFKDKISRETKLVSIVHTSNLDGYTLPIEQIIKIAHENGALVMIDGAQSAPHIKIDLKELDADFFAMSAHKMCGPSGMGCLYVKEEIQEEIEPFMTGGETVNNSWYHRREFSDPPEKFEAGLQNVAGIIGFGSACEYINKIGLENIEKHERELNEKITDGLKDNEKIELIGVKDYKKRSGIFNFRVKNKDPHEIGMLLNESSDIAVRTGMHCLHSWFNERNIEGSVRASTYFYNTIEEVEKFIRELKDILNYLV